MKKLSKRSIRSLFLAASMAVAAPVAIAAQTPANEQTVATETLAQTFSQQAGMSAAGLGSFEFGAPWVLLGLGVLPLWWLLRRNRPTQPKEIDFPAIRILMDIESDEKKPATMPVWQKAVGVSALSLGILAASQPTLNPTPPMEGDGPIVMVIDNGWASAPDWDERIKEIDDIINMADEQDRSLVILGTAPLQNGATIQASNLVDADEARLIVRDIEPQPWPVDREEALEALKTLNMNIAGDASNSSVIWLSDGLDSEGTSELASYLSAIGQLSIYEENTISEPLLLELPDAPGDDLQVTIERPVGAETRTVTLTARDENGRPLNKIDVELKAGDTKTEAAFSLPAEIRNQITTISINGENSAGATVLLDERWRHRPVGVARTGSAQQAGMSDAAKYLSGALEPYADLHTESIQSLLTKELAVIILTDDVMLSNQDQTSLDQWVQQGGTILRFAGPRLAAQTEAGINDLLLPVELRPGSRTVGNSTSVTRSAKLDEFDQDSPFYGMEVPADVNIEQQVLAQPGFQSEENTWARLEDGTPIITGKQHGSGQLILVHTTANMEWSDLALSGFFIDMLRTVVKTSQGLGSEISGLGKALPPITTLNGQGQLSSPSEGVLPLTFEAIQNGQITPQNPPGYYGYESVREAHNLSVGVDGLTPLPMIPSASSRLTYDEQENENNLAGPLLAGAFAIFIMDLLIIMGQRGLLPFSSQQNQQRTRNNLQPSKPKNV